jgi:hypothetical protein
MDYIAGIVVGFICGAMVACLLLTAVRDYLEMKQEQK